MWGVRLFDEASTSAERRKFRRQRRTINKRKWRIHLLKELFKEFVLKEDKEFFNKLRDSKVKKDDDKRFTLFVGDYTDKDYYHEFPTIYHLRNALLDSEKCKEYKRRNLYYRFLFLALHDMLKNRGNFLTENDFTGGKSTELNIKTDIENVIKTINKEVEEKDKINVDHVYDCLFNKNEKGKSYKKPDYNLISALQGREFDYSVFFEDEEKLEKKISFDNENWDESIKNDFMLDLLGFLFGIFSNIRLKTILNGCKHISESKINSYSRLKREVRNLKNDIKEIDSKCGSTYYSQLFNRPEKEKVTFSSYIGKYFDGQDIKSTRKQTKRDDLIKELNKIRNSLSEEYKKIYLLHLDEEDYLKTPNGADNRLIPYQIHRREMSDILEVFKKIENNTSTIKIADKAFKLISFKVPYYVGTLNKTNDTDNHWLIKNKGMENIKVSPFNFDEVVDKNETNENFIKRMLRNCTYLSNEYCLAKDTITYQSYAFYNTINKIKVNDKYLTKVQKESIRSFLISNKKMKLSKKALLSLLNCRSDSEVTGFSKEDKPIELNQSAIIKYQDIGFEIDNDFYQAFYDKVVNELCLSTDKSELERKKKRVREIADSLKTISISDEQVNKLAKSIGKSSWGNLSYKFLKALKFFNPDGVSDTMLNHLKDSNYNLMEILYGIETDNFATIDKENNRKDSLENLNNYLETKYVPPGVRRSAIQASRIVDEIKEITGSEPLKIIIEFTRENEIKPKETNSRYEQIKNLYRVLKADIYKEAVENLGEIGETDEGQKRLKQKKIYLYFLQGGKDLYTGKNIDFDELKRDKDNQKYDIDHIIPQSKIKDDSFNNYVLTNSTSNSQKGNRFPIDESIQKDQNELWLALKRAGLVSTLKYERLTRKNELTDDEIKDFVNRQKTTTDWINKLVAELFIEKFNKSRDDKFVLYSKSRHVSDFRKTAKLIKIRELNDYHHAHDAYLNIACAVTLENHLKPYSTTTNNYEKILEREFGLSEKSDNNDRIKYIRQIFKYNDLFVTKKNKIVNNKGFYDQLIISDGKIPIKKNMDPEKYGGYNSASTAFFSIIELDNKKQIIPLRTMDIVNFSYKGEDGRKIDKKQLTKYLEKTYKGCKVIYDILPIGQLVRIDKVIMKIAGMTGNNIIYHNTTQFTVDDEIKKILKPIFTYSRLKLKKEDEQNEFIKSKEITEEKNVVVLEYILNKIDSLTEKHLYQENIENCFKVFDSDDKKTTYGLIDIFKDLSIKEQITVIINIFMHAISPNTSNQGQILKATNSKKTNSFGDFKKNRNITYPFSVILQSTTGYKSKEIIINE